MGTNSFRPRSHKIKNGKVLLIREAAASDAQSIIEYIGQISGESDFLTMGPGEFEMTVEQEGEYLENAASADNQLYIIGLVDGAIVGSLSFSAGKRPRIRHSGELAMAVRRELWGLGIGSLLLDALIDWASEGDVIKKINLRVRTDNLRAVSLYEKKGFLTEGRLQKEIYLGGRYYDLYHMGLQI